MSAITTIISNIFGVIGAVLFTYWGWTLIAAFLMYLIWRNNRKAENIINTEHVVLQIIVPKNNEKKELSAEQMFASLHGILRPSAEINKENTIQDHISFEFASQGNMIHFYVWVPKQLKDYVESQIYAQYPTVQIFTMDADYSRADVRERTAYTTEAVLTKDDIFPIRTFLTFEVDPLAGLTTVLASLSETEEMWVQFLLKPIDDGWHARSIAYVDEIRNGKAAKFFDNWQQKALSAPFAFVGALFNAAFKPPAESKKEEKKDKKELSPGQTTINTAVETKAQKLGYGVKIRICYLGDNDAAAKSRMQALIGGFKQFNTINLNGFTNNGIRAGEDGLKAYQARLFEGSGYVLNIEELASLYHLPHVSVETPGVVYTSTKVGEPPANLPTLQNTSADNLSLIGSTTFRQAHVKFGIKRDDRKRHLYIVGKSGVGKSYLLELLTLSDLYQNQGFAVVDPHGDFAQNIMKFIPESRIGDVVYFNPADTEFPIGFNPMEVHDENKRNSVASEIVGVLKKMFGDSWGPRLEHILRFTLLALLESPDSTMLGITRMLTDKAYRKQVVDNVKDPVVKAFWVNEFASWNDKFASEAVAPVLNKVGAFTANPLVRNVLGQSSSSFNIRKMMDEGKILVVDLSRGKIGEDNAGILGALMITKIQLEAMSRADIADIEERRPFYLYVDEFQNFATESFAVILSEARKYGLYLTMANQYIAQMPDEVKDAVFGNVGSMITFRVGADDATYLAKYFEPVFEPADLVNLGIQNVYVTMSIDGETSLPFSARTLNGPKPPHDFTRTIIEQSRAHYSKSKAEVETDIAKWSGFGKKDETESRGSENSEKPKQPQIPVYEHKPNLAGIEPKKYSEQLKSRREHGGSGSSSRSRKRRSKSNR
ncbi:type IV secretory system conjugative DNA transfer family protein [Candidatus Saccharibacteria bacterium]|nr:type IV secretory system conjugative DNA transfer family protein [Candidatus Saccharibacteria bacterium]